MTKQLVIPAIAGALLVSVPRQAVGWGCIFSAGQCVVYNDGDYCYDLYGSHGNDTGVYANPQSYSGYCYNPS